MWPVPYNILAHLKKVDIYNRVQDLEPLKKKIRLIFSVETHSDMEFHVIIEFRDSSVWSRLYL